MNRVLMPFLGLALWLGAAGATEANIVLPKEVAPGVLGIVPGKSNHREVLEKLGPAEAVSDPGGSSTLRLCYRAPGAQDQVTLVFEWTGSSDPVEPISRYRVVAAPPPEVAGKCAPDPRVGAQLPLPGGIQLGMPCADALKRLGEPYRQTPAGLQLVVNRTRSLTPTELATITRLLGRSSLRSTTVFKAEGVKALCPAGKVAEVQVFSTEEPDWR